MTALVELGRATTNGQTLPLGVDDPVVAARAVRRALAAARRRAFDVTDLVVATNGHVDTSILEGFARRALGPHGSVVRVLGLVGDPRDVQALAARAELAATAIEAPGRGLVIAIGIASDGTTEARCLGAGSADRTGDLGAVG